LAKEINRFRVLHSGFEKIKIRTTFWRSSPVQKAQAAQPLSQSVATRAGDNNPANIATPALESHQHPQLAGPVCQDSGSVTSVTL
jgi:hypothetical protein